MSEPICLDINELFGANSNIEITPVTKETVKEMSNEIMNQNKDKTEEAE